MDLLTDDQFLEATGIPSVPSLKKVMATKIILPFYASLTNGGRERRWPSDQVTLGRLIVRVADATGQSLQAAALLLDGLTPGLCNQVGEKGRAVNNRILLGDRKYLWRELSDGRYESVFPANQVLDIFIVVGIYSEVLIIKF